MGTLTSRDALLCLRPMVQEAFAIEPDKPTFQNSATIYDGTPDHNTIEGSWNEWIKNKFFYLEIKLKTELNTTTWKRCILFKNRSVIISKFISQVVPLNKKLTNGISKINIVRCECINQSVCCCWFLAMTTMCRTLSCFMERVSLIP